MKEKITFIVYDCVRDIGEELESESLSHPDMDTRLIGEKSDLDSIGLVSLITDIEGAIEDEFGVSVILANESAFSLKNSPFGRVCYLVDYIESLLKKEL